MESTEEHEDMATFNKIEKLLNEKGIDYQLTTHAPVLTSLEASLIRGVTLASGAKAMLLKDNSTKTDIIYWLAVMSASKKFSWKLVKKLLNAKNMRFATPDEVFTVTGCRPGAVPPMGSVFGVPTIVDESLRAQGETINFNCGLRTHSVRLKFEDYFNIEKPRLMAVFTEEEE